MSNNLRETNRRLQAEVARLKKRLDEREPMLRTWAVALGIPTAIFTAGLAVVPFDFWFGFWTAIIGCLIYFCDALWFGRREPITDQILICVVPLAGIGLLCFLAFRPVDVEITGLPMPGAYKHGTMIGGIKWNSNYAELRIVVDNKSSTALANATLLVRTDLLIAHISPADPTSTCKASPATPGVEIAGGVMSRLSADGQVEESYPQFTADSSATVFRVTCDRLAPRRTTELVVALEASQSRKPPAWLSATAEFDAYGRERKASFQQCLLGKGKCRDILAVDAPGAAIRSPMY